MKQIFLKKEAKIPFTKIGYDRLLEEKIKLMAQRPEAVEHLRKSREMGDLSENGYYKASRAKLSFLDSRIRRVERLLRLAKIVESGNSGRVEIGSIVTITNKEKVFTYTIVGGYESDPSNHTISHLSPIGRALMGKTQSDSIEVIAPSGVVRYEILTVS